MDPATATITASLTDTNNLPETVDGLVERDGSFWIQNLPLHSGSNNLVIRETDVAGNSSSTNIVVFKSSVNLTIEKMAAADTGLSGTISADGYTVWVNGVRASNLGGGAWKADNVLMSCSASETMIVAQARAIPNGTKGSLSLENKSGEPSSFDYNPESTNAVDNEVEVEIPFGTYIKAYHYKT